MMLPEPTYSKKVKRYIENNVWQKAINHINYFHMSTIYSKVLLNTYERVRANFNRDALKIAEILKNKRPISIKSRFVAIPHDGPGIITVITEKQLLNAWKLL